MMPSIGPVPNRLLETGKLVTPSAFKLALVTETVSGTSAPSVVNPW